MSLLTDLTIPTDPARPAAPLNQQEGTTGRGRILHVIDALGAGGAERLLAAYLPRIARSGFRVEALVLSNRGGGFMAEPLRDAGIPVHLVRVDKLRNARQVLAFLRRVREIGPDLIHTHLEFATILGTMSGRLLHRPVVATLHTLDAPGFASRRDVRRWMMYRVMSQWTDRTICLTRSNAAEAEASGLGKARIVVLPNGVEVDQYDRPPGTGRAEVRSALRIPADVPLVATVCVLRPEKGVDRLVSAFAALVAAGSPAHLLVVGDGPALPELEALAQLEGIADRVHFAGFRRDVPDLLRASDIFALATRFDAQPTVIMEAMAARLPVVATAVGGIPNMVEQGLTGTLVHGDGTETLAAAIGALLDDPTRARHFGEAGYRRVVREFSMDRQIAKLCTLYDGLIAGTAEDAA